MLWWDLQIFLVETIPHILFMIKRRRLMPIIKQLLYQTGKSSHQICFIKKAVCKDFAIFTGIWNLFWDEVEIKRLWHKFSSEYFKVFNNTCFDKHLRMAASENNKKRFLGEASGYNDHSMTDMDGQWPKIGCNWLLTDPYLQCSLPVVNTYCILKAVFPIPLPSKTNFEDFNPPLIK